MNLYQEEEPRGLGGWLVVVLAGLAMYLVGIGANIARNLPALGVAIDLFTSDRRAAYLVAYTVIQLIVWCFGVVLVALFFRRNRICPKLLIVWAVLPPVLAVLQTFIILWVNARLSAASQLRVPGASDFARLLIVPAIWVPYFLKSRRVRNTFINA